VLEGKIIEEEDNYPTGRMLRHMCRVFDPEDIDETHCSYFIIGVHKNKYIEVYEDLDGVQVRYCMLDDAPKGVNNLLVDSWVKQH